MSTIFKIKLLTLLTMWSKVRQPLPSGNRWRWSTAILRPNPLAWKSSVSRKDISNWDKTTYDNNDNRIIGASSSLLNAWHTSNQLNDDKTPYSLIPFYADLW